MGELYKRDGGDVTFHRHQQLTLFQMAAHTRLCKIPILRLPQGLGDTFPREESEEERVKNEIESATESFEMPTTDLGNLEASTVTPGPLFQAENLQQTNKESETSTDKKIRPGMDNNKMKPSTDNNKIELELPVEMEQKQNTNRPSVAAAMQEMFMSPETSEEGTGAEMFMSQETEEEDGDEPKHEIVSMKDKYAGWDLLIFSHTHKPSTLEKVDLKFFIYRTGGA